MATSKKRGVPKPKEKEYIRQTTRIVYTPVTPEISESNTLLLGSEVVVVQLNKEDVTYKVVDVKTKRIIFMFGKSETMDDCKRKVRERLMRCSASIFEEVRVKK